MPPVKRRCTDPDHASRAAPHPGPRCASCHKEVLRVRREAKWVRHLWDAFRLTPDKYWRIHAKQAGVCAICARATGRPRDASAKNRQKRLAVEHDHACCPTTPTCGRCTRGLACGPCNRRVLGHLRDDPAAFIRGATYLTDPPAREIVCEEADAGR